LNFLFCVPDVFCRGPYIRIPFNETYAQADANLSFRRIGDMMPVNSDEWRCRYANSREPIAKHLVTKDGPIPSNAVQ